MNLNQMVELTISFRHMLTKVSYPGFNFVIVTKGLNHFLQIHCDSICNTTGKAYCWNSRKWYISPHSTEAEVVQTCFMAVLAAIEHEAREQFKYLKQPIFRPHYNLTFLVDLCQRGKISKRTN